MLSAVQQVECSPEDQEVQDAIAKGDAILQRLYQAPQELQQQSAAVCSDGPDTSCTSGR